ncbi:MAG: response regulator [Ferruginibacter sp.]
MKPFEGAVGQDMGIRNVFNITSGMFKSVLLKIYGIRLNISQLSVFLSIIAGLLMIKFKRILVVDDDIDDKGIFCDALEEITKDVECIMVNNGQEALQHLATPPPYDLIFLDLNMPVMNGYETLAVLKNDDKYRNIPVVVISTSKNERDKKRCSDLGANKYLTKPSSFHKFVDELKQILNSVIV